jgi:hypothetical protein
MLDPTIVSFLAIGTTIIGVATSAVLAAHLTAAKRSLALAQGTITLLRRKYDKAAGDLIAANVELTAFCAAEKRRQDQRVAASRSGHAKRAKARAAANGAG